MSKQIKLGVKTNPRQFFDQVKTFNGQNYSGMQVGMSHEWNYNNGLWVETKISPDKWKIHFESDKRRTHRAPINTGAEVGSGYHWYILADQKAIKIDSNTYTTHMDGLKFKVGHKRANWSQWSYQYSEQESYKQKVIHYLEQVLAQLKAS